jgi:molybdate transport system ATP-binding protein
MGKVSDEALLNELLEMFNLHPMLQKKVILLSSGELRKLQLMKALLDEPQLLIIDNPFIGLDIDARQLLLQILAKMADSGRVQLVLVLSRLDDIPSFITHVVEVKDRVVVGKLSREAYLSTLQIAHPDYSDLHQRILALPDANEAWEGDEAIRLNNVCIRYGERTILHQLDWVVKRGEKWALTGANGSGKSTLLSLICADNPQGYAQDISLFGRKRGTGESIWEIKKRIGYVSPEMHRAYQKNLPAIEIVASGLHDSIGLYKRPRPEQMGICLWWMEVMGIASLHNRPFLTLSSGEQRLCLLARAFVKDPQLLVLDEPLHGLDTYNRRRVKQIIESFACRKDKTLIMVTHYEEELPACINHHLRLQKH